jgi:predicted RNase H-like HicB family nuclease
MKRALQLTAVIKKCEDRYSAYCPQIDLTSEGGTADLALQNLYDVVKSYFDTAAQSDIDSRLQLEVYVSRLEIEIN